MIISPLFLLAQSGYQLNSPGAPGSGSSEDPWGGSVPPSTEVPIDGGLSLLVAAGIGYGAKKMRDKNKI